MNVTKISLWVIATVLALVAIPKIKPGLHYLKAEYGWWGWGVGMLACVGATAVLLWISVRLRQAARSKRTGQGRSGLAEGVIRHFCIRSVGGLRCR